MVILTDSAINLIRLLTDRQNMPASAGVRFTSGSSPGALTVRVTEHPNEGDKVVDASGARIFMDSTAARVFDGEVLDASMANGSIKFRIAHSADQPNSS